MVTPQGRNTLRGEPRRGRRAGSDPRSDPARIWRSSGRSPPPYWADALSRNLHRIEGATDDARL